jgi:hypothetical protein
MATWVWILIAIAVVIVIALVVAGAAKRRTSMLRQRFGPEYDRTVEARQGRRAAEAELRAREKQRAEFSIAPLPEATRLRFASEWRDIQERFVDQPAQALAAADVLITQVMQARGYRTAQFEEQADLVSVDHPDVVENYRSGHAVLQRSQTQQASTEDLREAMLRYRSLFDDLLRPDGTQTPAAPAGQADSREQTPSPASGDTDTEADAPAEGTAGAASAAPQAGDPAYQDEPAAPQTGDPAYQDEPARRGRP